MASINQKMRNQLKRILVPRLEANGFAGKFPHFTKVVGGNFHLLSIEFDKYGGGFYLDFGTTECGDKKMSWGEVIPESELTIAHVAADNRARLQAVDSSNSDREHWFRFDNLESKDCEELAKAVVELLPQIDKWLEENKKGSNISTFQP